MVKRYWFVLTKANRLQYSETSLTGAKDSVDCGEYYLRDVAKLDEEKDEELGFVPHWLKSKQEFAMQLLPKPKDGADASADEEDREADEGFEAFILFATDAAQKDKWCVSLALSPSFLFSPLLSFLFSLFSLFSFLSVLPRTGPG